MMSGYYICILLYCTVPHYDVWILYLYSTVLYCTSLWCLYIIFVYYWTVPHYDVWILYLYCTVLYCTSLWCLDICRVSCSWFVMVRNLKKYIYKLYILYTYFAWVSVWLFVCLFLSNKRQNKWNDLAQIFFGTSCDTRKDLWMIEFSKICQYQN